MNKCTFTVALLLALVQLASSFNTNELKQTLYLGNPLSPHQPISIRFRIAPANEMVSGCFPPPLYIRCKGPLFSVVEQCERDNERLDEVLQKCVVVDEQLSEDTSELLTELPTELPTEFPMLLSDKKN
ncbi:hypothetical protein LSAT2_021379, partial [Lamellibrachia satsuma]